MEQEAAKSDRSEKRENLRESIADIPVIDCDVHNDRYAIQGSDQFANHLDEPYSTFVRGENAPYFQDAITTSGRKHWHSVGPSQNGGDIQENLCDEFNIDYPILNPLWQSNMIQDRERAQQEVRAYNDMIIENYFDGYDKVHGTILVSPREPEKAVEEIERVAGEDQFVGVCLITAGTRKPLGDPMYDRIYRTAEDHNLAIQFHSKASLSAAREFPVLTWEVQKFCTQHTLIHAFEAMTTLASLIIQGVPVKFPDLNFVMVEQRLEWIPWLMGQLNREVAERPVDAPLLDKTPEEYLRENFYFGTQPLAEFNDPNHLKTLLKIIGADSIVFSTDYPHFDFDNPETTYDFLRPFGETEREKILYRNAMGAYNLDL